jgi:hypothetical protein
MKRMSCVFALVVLAGAALAHASLDEGAALLGQGKYAEAVDVFKKELAAHPTNIKAYLYLASAHEKLSQWAEAASAWDKFAKITESADERRTGESRARDCRDRAAGKVPEETTKTTETGETESEFSKYEKHQPVFLAPVKTPHFLVMAKNRALLDEAARECERHLKRISDVFLFGREWTQSITIRIYKDHEEYVREAGMPRWSGGGFSVRDDGLGGVLRGIDLFACDAKGKFIPDLLAKILPHELTHAVIHELFGERAFGTLPRAVNEGLAMYSEEGTQVLYERELSDAVNRGIYYKLNDLFRMTTYPPNVGLFYAQSASATRYIIEHLKAEQFQTFLNELKRGQTVNSALQTALGLTDDPLVAVEKNWVDMLKVKAAEYAKNPPPKVAGTTTPKTEPKTETKPVSADAPEPYDPQKNEKKPPGGDDDEKDVIIEVK